MAGVVASLPASGQDRTPPDAPRDATPGGFGTYAPTVIATIKPHAYTLAECLALADRNHPNLWAARARVELAHAQLSEATWLPFFNWTANASFAVLPPFTGTSFYTSAGQNARDLSFAQGIQPLVHFDFGGVIPLYTFGKITAAKGIASANIRLNEWDLEKFRQQTRMDVRRAYFGAMLSRDADYLAKEVLEKIDHAIQAIRDKMTKGDASASDVDRLRMEVYREEIVARSGEAHKGETIALASLRFLTGVQSFFDVPDEPLKRPDAPLAPVVRYLAAARLFRPEVNMARAGIEARKAQVDLARARFFPDFGLQLGADYTHAPGVTEQQNAFIPDYFNHFYYGAGLGLRWSLDILPNAARVAQAEAQLEETRALERLALGGLAVEVEGAYATVVEAKGREEAWDRAEHKSKEWVATVQDAIDLGTQDERALNEALRNYVSSRVNHLFALMDYNIALSQLALASGWDSAAPSGS
jgi:multidrug efflux system outer membrane protein